MEEIQGKWKRYKKDLKKEKEKNDKLSDQLISLREQLVQCQNSEHDLDNELTKKLDDRACMKQFCTKD